MPSTFQPLRTTSHRSHRLLCAVPNDLQLILLLVDREFGQIQRIHATMLAWSLRPGGWPKNTAESSPAILGWWWTIKSADESEVLHGQDKPTETNGLRPNPRTMPIDWFWSCTAVVSLSRTEVETLIKPHFNAKHVQLEPLTFSWKSNRPVLCTLFYFQSECTAKAKRLMCCHKVLWL